MRAGNLRHRITIQQATQVNDGMGSMTTTWSTLVTCWSAIWPVSAKEHVESDKIEMETSHRIRIRYYSGLDSSMRINFGSRTFKIISIINWEERNVYLDILAKEEV